MVLHFQMALVSVYYPPNKKPNELGVPALVRFLIDYCSLCLNKFKNKHGDCKEKASFMDYVDKVIGDIDTER